MGRGFYVAGPDAPVTVNNEFRAEQAIAITNHYRQYLMSVTAVPYIESAFNQIKLAANVGFGYVNLKFDVEIDSRLQDIIVCYLNTCGYKTSTTDGVVAVRWCD